MGYPSFGYVVSYWPQAVPGLVPPSDLVRAKSGHERLAKKWRGWTKDDRQGSRMGGQIMKGEVVDLKYKKLVGVTEDGHKAIHRLDMLFHRFIGVLFVCLQGYVEKYHTR